MKTIEWHGLKAEVLHVGDANWDIYKVIDKDLLISWPKDGSGASPSFFGNMEYFTNWRKYWNKQTNRLNK